MEQPGVLHYNIYDTPIALSGESRLTLPTAVYMTHGLPQFMMGRIYAGLELNKMSNLPSDYNSHYLHCIDYLRQSIMCSADLATEPHKPTDSEDNGPLDGSWGGIHGKNNLSHRVFGDTSCATVLMSILVCKDYDHVKGYLAG